MIGAIHPFPTMPSWRGAQLKHRENFTILHLQRITLGLMDDLFSA